MAQQIERIEIEIVMTHGRCYRFDTQKYDAMRGVLLKVPSQKLPGMTIADAAKQLRRTLLRSLFPGRARAGWWFKGA